MFLGLMTKKSEENSTLPALLRGALSRSGTMRFGGKAGSAAKKIFPDSFSYGPAAPNGWPPTRSPRDCTSMRTTSADTGAARTTNAKMPDNFRPMRMRTSLRSFQKLQPPPNVRLVATVFITEPANQIAFLAANHRYVDHPHENGREQQRPRQTRP